MEETFCGPTDGRTYCRRCSVDAVFFTTSLMYTLHFIIDANRSERPRHQTEIVSGAHPGAGARIAYTRAMSEHRCFPRKETKYSYSAFQTTSQKSI